jgi:RNA polymerase sigma-70 factor (ECF subfamily)
MRRGQQHKRFDAVVWPHAVAVLRLAKLLVHDDSVADDLAQETLLKAFRSLEGLRDDSKAKPWLMSILRHAHTDRLRHEQGQALSLDALEVDVATNTEPDPLHMTPGVDPDVLIERLGDQEVIAALRGLPRDIRWTLLLVDVEGMQEDEAAEVLIVPLGTIKSRLFRGRRMLREVLVPAARRLHLAI